MGGPFDFCQIGVRFNGGCRYTAAKLIAEERARSAAGTGVDAVIRARRLS
jgi:hypothetical protein